LPEKLSYPDHLKDYLNKAISMHLEQRLGASTLKTVNFHLEQICGTDLSRLASNPPAVEKGLQVLFGQGAEEIIRASTFAAFRAVRFVPEKEYDSLQDAFAELFDRISSESRNSSGH
jgi:hypothetical protein